MTEDHEPRELYKNNEENAEPQNFLVPPFTYTHPPPTVIAQGAEAILYRTHFLTPARPAALKYRPAKSWRHPVLDLRLTRRRILSEARILVRCRREGVSVPAVLSLDWEGGELEGGNGRKSGGWMMMEWIEGETVRTVLDQWLTHEKEHPKFVQEEVKNQAGKEVLVQNEELAHLMGKIGMAIGRMHEIGVVHGDLTTSNLMLRPKHPTEISSDGDASLPKSKTLPLPESGQIRPELDGDIILIDFGLAAQSVQEEDKAVDLYVLERAFGSTHPTAEGLFTEVLKAYGTSYRGARVALKRLEGVRMRGRKRSMLG